MLTSKRFILIFIILTKSLFAYGTFASNSIKMIYSINDKYFIKFTPKSPTNPEKGVGIVYDKVKNKELWRIDRYYYSGFLSDDGKTFVSGLLDFWNKNGLFASHPYKKHIKNLNNYFYTYMMIKDYSFSFDSTIVLNRLKNTENNLHTKSAFIDPLEIPYYNKLNRLDGKNKNEFLIELERQAVAIRKSNRAFDGKYLSIVTNERLYIEFDVKSGKVLKKELWENLEKNEVVVNKFNVFKHTFSIELSWYQPILRNINELHDILYKVCGIRLIPWHNGPKYAYQSKVVVDRSGRVLSCKTVKLSYKKFAYDYQNLQKLLDDDVVKEINSFVLKQVYDIEYILDKKENYETEILIHCN